MSRYILMARLLQMLWIVFSCNAIATTMPKECVEKISPDLVRFLGNKYPELQIPRLSDLDQQSIGYDLKNGGDGCYAVTDGDFGGNGQKDTAILLTSSAKVAHLVVALKKGESWEIYQLPTFCESIQYCYVEPEKPGKYVRTQAAEDPVTGIERTELSSKHTSLRSGTLESTGIVYVYSKGRWSYVWVSD